MIITASTRLQSATAAPGFLAWTLLPDGTRPSFTRQLWRHNHSHG